MIKRLIFISLFAFQLVFADQTATIFYDPKTHKVKKPPVSPASSYDYDFSGLNLAGIAAGAYQPINPFLTSVVGLGLTDKMFYMLDPNTADAVEMGSGLVFSGGTLGIAPALISGQPSDIDPTADDVMLTLDTGTGALRKVILQDFTDSLTLDSIQDSVTGFTITINTAALTANRTWTAPNTDVTIGSGGGGGTPGGSSTQIQYNNAGAFGGTSGETTNGTVVTLAAPVTNSLQFAGNISQAAWGVNGVKIKGSAQTFTDSSSSGSVSGITSSSSFPGATIAASSAATYAEYVNAYFKDPVAGTNVTMTNKYSLAAESAIFGNTTPGKTTISNAGLLTLPQLTLAGNISQAAWGPSGIAIAQTARTLTDSSSSGSVSGNTVTYAFGNNTIAASSATTYANYISAYFKDPVAGSNVTMTAKYALGADSAIFGTSNQATFSTAGVFTVPGSIVTPTVAGSGGSLSVGGSGATSISIGSATSTTTLAGTATSLGGPSGSTEELRFNEDLANGATYIGFKAPSSVPSTKHFIFPSNDAAGALTSDGAGNLSWTSTGGGNVSNTGTPTSGQLALWTNATTIQGLTALPAANFPALTGEVTNSAGSLATTVGTMTHDLNLGTHKATNVVDPTSAQDGATKNYVDTTLSSFDAKPSVGYASTAALPANTYANGSSGVGATLTGSSNGPLIIDSVTLAVGAVGQRILVSGESTAANDGWYTVTQVGVVAVSPYILTRATESDQAAEIGAGYLTSVIAPNTLTPGSANNGKVFISVAADPFTVGTTSLTFSQVGGTYAAGTGLSLSGSTFSINTATTVDKTTAQALTNKDLTGAGNTFPTFNQNTTGSAAKLTTARNIGGVAFDGTANIVPTNISGGNGTTLLGSVPYQSATDTTTQLAPNTTTTRKFLRETGDGTNGAAPAWDTIAAGDVPTLNQNTTGSAATLTTSRNLWGQGFNGSANVAGNIELGTDGTTDTTLARAAAGQASIEGVNVVTTSSTDTLTNKTISSSTNTVGDGNTYSHDLTAIPNQTGGWNEYFVTTSDFTTTNLTATDVTGMVSGTLSNSAKYEFEVVAQLVNAADSTGMKYALHGAGTGTAATVNCVQLATGSTAANGTAATYNAVDTLSAAVVSGSGISGTIWLRGFFVTTSTGTATMSFQIAKVTSNTATVKVGSVLRLRKAHT